MMREAVLVLGSDLDDWAGTYRNDPWLTATEVEAVEAVGVAFGQLLRWIERCPDRCQEALWWTGGYTLGDVALPLADVVAVSTGPAGSCEPVKVLRGLLGLQVRGAVGVSPEWRVGLVARPSQQPRGDHGPASSFGTGN